MWRARAPESGRERNLSIQSRQRGWRQYTLDSQSFDSGAGCHDVRKGIEGADFVKLDVLLRNSMNLAFCDGQPLEYRDAL